MDQIVNYTRLTTSDRLQDKFLTCQVYQPVDPEQVEKGMIFSQVEILNPWYPTSQIGQTVINTIIREYYRGTNRSDLINFETAVKRVNETLAQTAQNGDTDWIGKLSGVFILIVGPDIHIAQTGRSKVYLYRGNNMNHVTEGLDPDEAPHPLKTFGNITSGTLQAGDKVVVGNQTFFDRIKPHELKNITSQLPPMLTAIECAKELKSADSQDGNAIFIEVTTKENLANIPANQKSDTVYLDKTNLFRPGSALKKFGTKNLFPALSSMAKATASGARRTGKFLAPHLRRAGEFTKNRSKKAFSLVFKTKEHKLPSVKEPLEPEIEPKGSPSISSAPFKNLKGGTKTLHSFKNRGKRMLFKVGVYPSQKSKAILIVFAAVMIVLAIIIALSIHSRNSKNSDKAALDTLNQITTLQNQAATAALTNDETTAVKNYQHIVSLAQSITNKKYKSRAQDAQNSARVKIAAITKLTTLKTALVSELKSPPTTAVAAGDSIVVTDQAKNILSKKTNETNFKTLATFNTSSSPTSGVYLEDENLLVYAFQDKTLVNFNLDKKTIQKDSVTLDGIGKIKSFDDNVYVLNPAQNQIYKVTATNNVYDDSTDYLKYESVVLGKAVDLAIDGQIFVLNPDGSVTVLSRGNKVNEFVISLPGGETTKNWQNIFTSVDSDTLFVSAQIENSTRIAELKKDGKFIAQWSLEDTSGAKAIDVDPNTRKAYVAKDNAVLTFEL